MSWEEKEGITIAKKVSHVSYEHSLTANVLLPLHLNAVVPNNLQVLEDTNRLTSIKERFLLTTYVLGGRNSSFTRNSRHRALKTKQKVSQNLSPNP